jgi:hypothetical protein
MAEEQVQGEKGKDFGDAVERLLKEAGGSEVKVYKVMSGKKDAGYYIAGLDLQRVRILAVKVVKLYSFYEMRSRHQCVWG